MSAEELRRRSIEKLNEARDRAVEFTLNARFRPSTYGGSQYVPASTAEEIALQAIEGNAMARALTLAIDTINEVNRRMHQPDDDKVPEQTRKETY